MLLIRNVILVSLVLVDRVEGFDCGPETTFAGRVLTFLAYLIVILIKFIFLVYTDIIEIH